MAKRFGRSNCRMAIHGVGTRSRLNLHADVWRRLTVCSHLDLDRKGTAPTQRKLGERQQELVVSIGTVC